MRTFMLLAAVAGVGMLFAGMPATRGEGPLDKSADRNVKPGDVEWHPDFKAACRAADESGKPVMLFQLMGNLDDRFC